MPESDANPLPMLRSLAHREGFAMVGIAPAEASERADFLRGWLRDHKHGEMAYLAAHLDVRLDPRELLPNARSVICVADRYPARQMGESDSQLSDKASGPHSPTVGRVARYAWGDDYHKTIKKRLFKLADALSEAYPDAGFRCAVDTAPLLEREVAAAAGLGWVGKHTLLIHPRLGSWLLLGEIVTTLTLPVSSHREGRATLSPADAVALPVVTADHCGTCTRCIDACPTACIDPAGYAMDASRCISYLTIEHRGMIDPSLHEAMGDWVAGCDVCQEVCPHNQPFTEAAEFSAGDGGEDFASPALAPAIPPSAPAIHPRYEPGPLARGIALLDLLNWSAEDRQRALQGSALKRIKLDMFRRNALIAAGNSLREREDAALRARVTEIASDDEEPPLVRDTAQQILATLKDR